MQSFTFSGSLLSAASVQPPVPVERCSGVGPGQFGGFPFGELVRRHRFLELEMLPVAALEHRGRAGDRRRVEVVVVDDRRDTLGRGSAVDEILVEA